MILQAESISRRIRSYHRPLVCHQLLWYFTSSRDFSELGIEVGTVGFQAFFEGTVIGRMFFPIFLSSTPP
jgi:hypothetical protein